MATRTVTKTWKVDGVLTDPTSVKLSDPTGTYGIKDGDDNVIVADDTAMTKVATGTYEYSFTDSEDTAYTAYIEIVYGGNTYRFEEDLPARAATGAMAVSYQSLLERVGHFAFGIRSGFSADQTSDVEDAIRDGLRKVYAAHTWSFFRPIEEIVTTAPYTTGTVTVVDGVVTLSGGTFPSWAAVGVLAVGTEYYDVDTRDGDTQITLEDTSVAADAGSTYSLARPEYDLPTTCEAIDGKLYYEPGQADWYPAVEPRSDEEIMRKRQDDPYNDRPLYFGIRTVAFDPTVGSRRRLALYPTPDAAYVLKARLILRPTMIDATNKYPVGGELISQLILEACLSAAEQLYDGNVGVHTEQFAQMLPSAILADQERSSPKTLGPDAPKGENQNLDARKVQMGDVTLNGTTM